MLPGCVTCAGLSSPSHVTFQHFLLQSQGADAVLTRDSQTRLRGPETASGRLVDTARGRAGGSARFPPPGCRVSLAAPAAGSMLCTGVQMPRREGSEDGPTEKIGAHRSSGRGECPQAKLCAVSLQIPQTQRVAHTCYFLALTAQNVNSERRTVSGLVPADCWAPSSLTGTQQVASKSTRNDKPSRFPRASRRRGQPVLCPSVWSAPRTAPQPQGGGRER